MVVWRLGWTQSLWTQWREINLVHSWFVMKEWHNREKIINESPYLDKLSLDLILSKRRWSPFLISHIVLIIITIVIILGHPHLNHQDPHHHQCRDPDLQQWWYFHGVIWVDWNPQLLWNFPDDHPQPFTFRPSPLFQTIIYESLLIINTSVIIITWSVYNQIAWSQVF